MLAVCCWLSGGACVAMSPVAFFVPTPVPGPMMAVLGALVGLVMCAVGRMVARSLRTLVVAREGIFVSSAEELTGARWEGLVEASVTRIGTKPHLLLQKGGRADNVERICLSTFDVSPEDLAAPGGRPGRGATLVAAPRGECGRRSRTAQAVVLSFCLSALTLSRLTPA